MYRRCSFLLSGFIALVFFAGTAHAYVLTGETRSVPKDISRHVSEWDQVEITKGDTLTGYCKTWLRAIGNGSTPMRCAVMIARVNNNLLNRERFQTDQDLHLIIKGEKLWMPSLRNATKAQDPFEGIDVPKLQAVLGLPPLVERVELLEGELASMIARHEARIEEQEARLEEQAKIAERLAAVQSGHGARLDQLEEEHATHQERVEQLEDGVNELAARVSEQREETETLSGRVTAAADTAEQALARANAQASSMNDLDRRVSEVDRKVDKLANVSTTSAPAPNYALWALVGLALLLAGVALLLSKRGAHKRTRQVTELDERLTETVTKLKAETEAVKVRADSTTSDIAGLKTRVDSAALQAEQALDLATISYCIGTDGHVCILEAARLLSKIRALPPGKSIDLPVTIVGAEAEHLHVVRTTDQMVTITGLGSGFHDEVDVKIDNLPGFLAKAVRKEQEKHGDGFRRRTEAA